MKLQILLKNKNYSRCHKCGWWLPSIYPDLKPEPLISYIEEIKKSLKNLKLKNA